MCYVVTLEYWEGNNVKSWLTLLSILIESTSQHVKQMIMFSRGTVVRYSAKLIFDKNISSQKVFINKYVMSNVFIFVISWFLKDT